MQKKEKDESIHVRLTKTKHTSILEVVDQLERIERMLKWLILDRCNDTVKEHYRKAHLPDEALEDALWKRPDISDILRRK